MRIKSLILLLFISLSVQAQNTYKFSEGLVAGQVHQYGRQAVVHDPVAYQLYTNSWKSPVAGQFIAKDDEGNEVNWTAIEGDSVGNFSGRSLSNGYLYLTYESEKAQNALMHIAGHYMFYLNGTPFGGDIYSDGWLYVPVHLKKGTNEILIRTSRWGGWRGIAPELVFSEKEVFINPEDATLPHVVLEEPDKPLWAALVAVNNTDKALDNLSITTMLEGKEMTTEVASVTSLNYRKLGFQLDPTAIKEKGSFDCIVQLKQKGRILDEKTISIKAVAADAHHSYTFISEIDGSVQYYSVAPQVNPDGEPAALFLSVHGAGVEAIGQARAYKPKDWGVLVAPTNRRPRGFNWEDWGRLDAMEVLALAKNRYKPDPQKIYLTGHSMGGHGTWYLGATFPGMWAAIAPCAGYPTMRSYGSSDGEIPEKGSSVMEDMLLRASDPSDVIALAENYKAGGVYIHHGDSDKVVPVTHARQMRELLSTFHPDFSYYEYPGGSHWFSNKSVDWPPLFEYFKWHTIQEDSVVDHINFSTANPAISSVYKWATIMQQEHSLEYSRLKLVRDRNKKTINGTAQNIKTLRLSLADFNIGDTISICLKESEPISHILIAEEEELYLHHGDNWQIGESPKVNDKGPVRNGTFKEPFNHQMVFVYSTKGSKAENEWSYQKARFDAQVWYYRANGAVDIIADKEFKPSEYADRGVILYGNADTNAAWSKLLRDCPINIENGQASIGEKQFKADDIGAYFMWPRADSDFAAVAVVSGTGLSGMKSTEANQYFAGGSGFPDYLLFSANMMIKGTTAIKVAGFYGNDWSIENGDWAE